MAAAKTATLIFRIEPALKEVLRAAANREHRSFASMAEVMIRVYCGRNNIDVPPNDHGDQPPRIMKAPGRHDHFPHPGPMFPGFPARNPSGGLRPTKSAPGGFVPEGEGEQDCCDFQMERIDKA